MPLVAHSELPTFERLIQDGETVILPELALHQDIRAMHIGFLNMMPDAALAATERQFFRLVGGSNQIAQVYMHPFTFAELERGKEAQAYVDQYYESFEDIKRDGLDALIITGANVSQPDLSLEPFWKPLVEVIDWAHENVTSVICSCLATHAVMQFKHGQTRQRLSEKRWGVFAHHLVDRTHPLVSNVNTLFDVPHSRFNEITREQFVNTGHHVLVQSRDAGVHMAVSEDLFRVIYFQGHPEYDTISLLKEYKREVNLFLQDQRDSMPVFPRHYFSKQAKAILTEYLQKHQQAQKRGAPLPDFPEHLISAELNNTWRDTAAAILNNWLGKVYATTHFDRKLPFFPGINPLDPLGLRK